MTSRMSTQAFLAEHHTVEPTGDETGFWPDESHDRLSATMQDLEKTAASSCNLLQLMNLHYRIELDRLASLPPTL